MKEKITSSMRRSELPSGWGRLFGMVGRAAGIRSHRLPKQIRRVVIFKLWAAGECLMATPVVAALRARWNPLHITVVTGTACAALWRMCPGVDEIIAVDERPFIAMDPILLHFIAARLSRIPADAALILHHSYFFTVFSALAFRCARSGPDREGEGFLYHFTQKPVTSHRIDDHLAAAYALGTPAGDWHMTIAPPVAAVEHAQTLLDMSQRWICVAPGGGRNIKTVMPQKIYPIAKLAYALKLLKDKRDLAVVVIGDKADREIAGELSAGLAKAGIHHIDLSGKAGWEETAAVMSLCHGFVGNDSAPMHLAAALGIPTLGIFGPTSPAETGPRGRLVAVLEPPREHGPCYRHGVFNAECTDPCIDHIRPGDIAQMLNSIIA
jgi:ADP-heptose:LPS heptosyltransferase